MKNKLPELPNMEASLLGLCTYGPGESVERAARRRLLETESSLPQLIERLEKATGRGADECWPWPRKTDAKGRGRIWINGKIMLAHRAVWEAENGPIPAGMLLCHHCDNAGCVNPGHMYVGTHADNMRDMKERKRYFAAKEPERVKELGRVLGASNTWVKGAHNPKARLSEANAKAIKGSDEKTAALAKRYGVDRTTIQRIRRGALWTS